MLAGWGRAYTLHRLSEGYVRQSLFDQHPTSHHQRARPTSSVAQSLAVQLGLNPDPGVAVPLVGPGYTQLGK